MRKASTKNFKYDFKYEKKNLGKLFAKDWMLFLEAAFLLMICLIHAVSAGHYANFYPIDGTFQNYNPVRRLLNGQVPYRDFQDYLGLGHLYSGAFFTWLFGGNYRESLVAFSFLTILSFAALSILMAYGILGTMKRAVGVTCALLVCMLTQTFPFVNGLVLNKDILDSLNYALGSGNSDRLIRGLILTLSAIMPIIVFSKNYFSSRSELASFFAGIVAGFAFLWSNDFGICCYICIFIMTFSLSLIREEKLSIAIRNAFIELCVSVGGILFFAMVFTRGHIKEWFSATLGTGGVSGVVLWQRRRIKKLLYF